MGFENIQVKECWRKCGADLISPLAYVKLHIISVKLQLTGKSSLTYQLNLLIIKNTNHIIPNNLLSDFFYTNSIFHIIL